MRIEHAGIQVKDPAAMADWYVAQLGFSRAWSSVSSRICRKACLR
jgi:catechol 2,3-dioxygenase-like lactoylglutathione lyase family enzyme